MTENVPYPQKGGNGVPDIRDQFRALTNQSQRLQEEDVERAEEILKIISKNPHPSAVVSEHLDEIIGLLPAILTVNIRQASRDDNPELVHSLQHLLAEFHPPLTKVAEMASNQDPWKSRPASYFPRILFVGSEDESSSYRQKFPATALKALGCQTTITSSFPLDHIKEFDVVIVHRPHLNQEYLHGMAVCRATNIPVIVDIDLDYKTIPLKHPDYDLLSLSKKETAQGYTTALLLADQIISPSRRLVSQLRSEGYTTFYTPPGWNKNNPLWSKSPPPRHTVNIGWLGRPGQSEDIALIRRMVVRLMRQIPQTTLVIGSNPEAYHLFKNFPESRKLYLPPSRLEDFPYSLGQIDILIAPLRKIPFNQALSDRVLMEAGARGIPWVASPIPSFTQWGQGGLFAESLDEWYTQLHQLVINPELRSELGEQGKKKALEREMNQLAPIYLDLIDLIRWSKSPEADEKTE